MQQSSKKCSNTSWVILKLTFLLCVLNIQHISFHLQTISQMLCLQVCPRQRGLPHSQVCVQDAGAWEAMCTRCTEVDGWVSRLGGCDVQGEMFGRLIHENSESFNFVFVLIWTNVYNELGTFSRFLLIPRKVDRATVGIRTVDNSGVSLLDIQGRRMLIHFLSMADPYTERKSQRKENSGQIIMLQNFLFLQ